MHHGLKRHARACLLAGATLPSAAAFLFGISPGAPSRPEYAPPPRASGALVVTAGQHLPLKVLPDPVSLGRFAQGQAAQCEFRVVNPGSETVRIDRAQLSCTCLNVGLMPVCIGPAEATVLTVDYDPTDDPEFFGRLSVEVAGLDAAGRAAFLAHVEFEVTPIEQGAAPAQAKSRKERP